MLCRNVGNPRGRGSGAGCRRLGRGTRLRGLRTMAAGRLSADRASSAVDLVDGKVRAVRVRVCIC